VLTCLPRSVFGWEFDVSGAEAGPSFLTVEEWDHGGIQHGLLFHEICKHGMLKEHWTLESHGQQFAEAFGHGWFRRYKVSTNTVQLEVNAEGMFSNDFEILCGGSAAGRIRRENPFTRRATIECSDVVPEVFQLFAFWLAALAWKRASRS
jgi:hypothetical protein